MRFASAALLAVSAAVQQAAATVSFSFVNIYTDLLLILSSELD